MAIWCTCCPGTTTSGATRVGWWIWPSFWRRRGFREGRCRRSLATLLLVINEIIKRAVGVEQELGFLFGYYRPVPFIDSRVSESSGREHSLGRADASFHNIGGVAARGVVMPR